MDKEVGLVLVPREDLVEILSYLQPEEKHYDACEPDEQESHIWTRIARLWEATEQPPRELFEELLAIRNSCMEGFDGSWDSGGGADGFIAMSEGVESIARRLGIKLPEYEKEEEEG